MKTEKQTKKKENQDLKEWKKPELKVLDKRGTETGNEPETEEGFYEDGS